jgi:hypothetical protein
LDPLYLAVDAAAADNSPCRQPPVLMTTTTQSRPRISLRDFFLLTTGFALSLALLGLGETHSSAALDVLALAGGAACAVYLESKYVNVFRRGGALSLCCWLSVFLLVLFTRQPARAFWGGYHFNLPGVTLLALHPFTPAVLGALAAVAWMRECSARRRDLSGGFVGSAAPIGFGIGIVYCLALLRPFLQMLKNL